MMKPERVVKVDKSGRLFEIGMSRAEDFPSLLEMYRVFSPKPASQGVPPETPEACHRWLKNLFEIGQNLLAWRSNHVIGHAALAPDVRDKSAEFVIFVGQDDRNLGIGTELTHFTLEKSRQLGIDAVWLTVNIYNFIAVKLYKKVGFEDCDRDRPERIMCIKLESI